VEARSMIQLRMLASTADTNERERRVGPVRRPIIVANPPGDADFRALIDRSLVSGVEAPQNLESILRTRFPKAVVRPRELSNERFDVWYVYRDGHWIRGDSDGV
jgi:hypothetical protein